MLPAGLKARLRRTAVPLFGLFVAGWFLWGPMPELRSRPSYRDGDMWPEGATRLHRAAFRGRLDRLGYHLQSETDVDVQDMGGRTPLVYAIRQGQVEAAGFLLEHGADLDIEDREGMTALDWAVDEEDRACIDLLLEHGALEDSEEGRERNEPEPEGSDLTVRLDQERSNQIQ